METKTVTLDNGRGQIKVGTIVRYEGKLWQIIQVFSSSYINEQIDPLGHLVKCLIQCIDTDDRYITHGMSLEPVPPQDIVKWRLKKKLK